MDDLSALLALIRAPMPAAARCLLIDRHGSAAAALRAGPSAWRLARLTGKAMAALARPDAPAIDRDLAWLDQPGHRLIGWQDPDYPGLLRLSEEPPAGLFVAGDATLLWHPQIALVGSRRPSPEGAANARQFARALAAQGLVVTSGLAEGIDTEAHQGALLTGRTIAVIGTGPDQVFPASNALLMARIAERGAVVSEYPPGTPGRAGHFPARNRILAGLSLGTLVIEAALRSGALITARLANQAGREVFALPGSIHNPMAQGCHRLIRQGAALVDNPDEVQEGLVTMALTLAEHLRARLDPAAVTAPKPALDLPEPPPEQGQVLAVLGFEPVPIDQLAERSGLTVPRLSAILLAMELDGRISADNGRYRRLA